MAGLRRAQWLVLLCLSIVLAGCLPSRQLGSLVAQDGQLNTPTLSVTIAPTSTPTATPTPAATESIASTGIPVHADTPTTVPEASSTRFIATVSKPTISINIPIGTPTPPTQSSILTDTLYGESTSGQATPTINAYPTPAVATQVPSQLNVPTVKDPPTITPTPTASFTPTSTPTPAPCPRSADFHKLSYYPRPLNDDGYGFHINASPYPPGPAIMRDQVIPLLNKLHARWVTVWVADDNQVPSVKMLVDAGFEVVLRLHPQGAPHPDFVPDVNWVRKYTAVGVHYIVSGNEPNLIAENKTHKVDSAAIAWEWVQSSRNIKAAGGIPMLYPMSPGGDGADSRDLLRAIFDWTKQHGMLDSFDGAALAIHNRPLNKPLDVRDSTSFLDYEWTDDLVRSYLGRSLPMIGTEAGYAYNDLVDPAYPRITDTMHRDYNLAIVTGFRDGRWRDSLFAEDFWLLGGFGHYAFPADWWVDNPLYFGKSLPALQALENLPPFVRRVTCN